MEAINDIIRMFIEIGQVIKNHPVGMTALGGPVILEFVLPYINKVRANGVGHLISDIVVSIAKKENRILEK